MNNIIARLYVFLVVMSFVACVFELRAMESIAEMDSDSPAQSKVLARAKLNLGQMYLSGAGCERNFEKAISCFDEAAIQEAVESVQLQLQDEQISISYQLARTLETTIKPVTLANGSYYVAISLQEWKLIEPYFILTMLRRLSTGCSGRYEKKLQRLCNMSCGKGLKHLREVAQKINFEAFIEVLDLAEKRLRMLPDICINDNDTLLLLLHDGKQVNVCWRLAKLSRTLETLVTSLRESFFQIPLLGIDLETWHTIRQLLALMYRKQKKEGRSLERADKKINFILTSLDEAKLIRFFSAVNYLEIPQLYEKTKTVLRGRKIANYGDEALLELPATERNLIIRSALFEVLGQVEGDVLDTYTYAESEGALALLVQSIEGDRILAAYNIGSIFKAELLTVDLKNDESFEHSDGTFILYIDRRGYIISAEGNLNGDLTFKIWDHMSYEPVRVWTVDTFGVPGLGLTGICMGIDKRLYSCHEDGAIRVWHEETGELLHKLYRDEFNSHSSMLTVCIVHDDSEKAKVVAGSKNGYLLIWELNSGRFLRRCEDEFGQAEGVYALCASQDGRIFAGSFDGTLRVWDSENGALLTRLKFPVAISALCNPSECVLICALDDGTINLIDSYSGTALMTCKGHTNCVTTLAVEKGEILYSGAPTPDSSIRAWDLRILNALKNMNLEQAQDVLRLLYRRRTGVTRDNKSVEQSWHAIRKIIGLKKLSKANEESSCEIQ